MAVKIEPISVVLDEHFLDGDAIRAAKEVLCIADCITGMFSKIDKQDYNGALIHIENLRRSVAELKRLNDRKKIYEQVRDLLQEVLKGGVSNG